MVTAGPVGLSSSTALCCYEYTTTYTDKMQVVFQIFSHYFIRDWFQNFWRDWFQNFSVILYGGVTPRVSVDLAKGPPCVAADKL